MYLAKLGVMSGLQNTIIQYASRKSLVEFQGSLSLAVVFFFCKAISSAEISLFGYFTNLLFLLLTLDV